MAKKALIVSDMQKDLCYDLRRREKVGEMLRPLLKVIDLFGTAGLPIFHVYLSLPKNDEQFERFGDKYCIEDTEGAEFIPEILPLRGKAIKKRKHSAFFETELDACLKAEGVSEIYLTGLQTQICIMTTAADASFRGYKTNVIRECVVSTRDERKGQALEWIEKYIGYVVSLEQVVAELSDEQEQV